MTKYPYLSGGVLFLLMLECNKETAKGNVDVINGLVKAVTGNNLMASRSDASNYLGCKRSNIASIPFYEQSTRDEYDNLVKTKYTEPLSRMKAFVDVFLMYKHEWFVKAVLDLMEQDRNNDFDDVELYITPDGKPVKKADALGRVKYHLPSFMVGVMHFIVTCRGNKNEEGAETIAQLSENPNNHGRKYVGTLGRRITRQINVTMEEIKRPPHEEAAEDDSRTTKEENEATLHTDRGCTSIYIDKQVFIERNEVKKIDIKDSYVTLNL